MLQVLPDPDPSSIVYSLKKFDRGFPRPKHVEKLKKPRAPECARGRVDSGLLPVSRRNPRRQNCTNTFIVIDAISQEGIVRDVGHEMRHLSLEYWASLQWI